MSNAPVGRSFDEMVQSRVGREAAFAEALLQMAVQEMLAGDLDVARSLIRDVIKGSIRQPPTYSVCWHNCSGRAA